jgi:hypothetical protein
MRWVKKGRIFCVKGEYCWNKTHAQGPIVDLLGNGIWRIYYSTRDAQNRSRTSFIEVEAGKPENILYVHDKPLLELGELGAFDDCGVMGGECVKFNGRKYLYYIGWNVRNTISYHLSIGMAVSDDGVNFQRVFKGPVLERNKYEPFMCGACSIIVKDGGWRIWYTSGVEHVIVNGRDEPIYDIKTATSFNGIDWAQNGAISIKRKNDSEALGVPRVIFEDGVYKMWYSYRSLQGYRECKEVSYRIGYAESHDGESFVRMDKCAGIDISEGDDWDSQMIAYGDVVKYQDKKYMFYNGNGFGKSGFGYAIWED